MRLDEMIAVGHRLHVYHRDRAYPSLLLDLEGQSIYIGVPQLAGRWITFPPGSEIEVAFGVSDKGLFRFTALVEGEVRMPAPALKLTVTGQIVRQQQRRFFRLSAQLPVNFRPITVPESHRTFITFVGYTADLSAGGLLFVSDEHLVEGDILELDFLLGDVEVLGLLAEVVRSTNGSDGLHTVAVSFLDVDRRTEAAIIRWIFQEQARRRRLGL